jgi:Ribbon-helix-helix protein, copG family
MIAMTLNRSAGRIEDELWEAFLAKARSEGLSNSNAMRRMIRTWVGMPEPVSLADTGSSGDRLAAS